MVAPPITEDYYQILEVLQTAKPDAITKSYKRLALKLHPDRNSKADATEAFQKLARAYETLKDETKRRAYDLIYPSITRTRPSPQSTHLPHPPHPPHPPQQPKASTTEPEAVRDAAQLEALKKSKQERSERWRTRNKAFESAKFEQQRDIRRLEAEIKNLASIAAAEAAEEAQRNSWGAWLLSPIYKRKEDSEEEQARKDIKRQERRLEKDMKERRLALRQNCLNREEQLLRMIKEEVDAADLADDRKINVIYERMRARERAREMRERQERERVARETQAKISKQQQEEREKREREEMEAYMKRQAETQAAEQKRQEELAKQRKKQQEEYTKQWHNMRNDVYENASHREQRATCSHDGWWPKILGRTACPECAEVWTYLLQCPGCAMKACPRCQSGLRPRRPRVAAWTNRRTPRVPRADYYPSDWD